MHLYSILLFASAALASTTGEVVRIAGDGEKPIRAFGRMARVGGGVDTVVTVWLETSADGVNWYAVVDPFTVPVGDIGGVLGDGDTHWLSYARVRYSVAGTAPTSLSVRVELASEGRLYQVID